MTLLTELRIKIAILNYKYPAPNGASEMTVFQNLKLET